MSKKLFVLLLTGCLFLLVNEDLICQLDFKSTSYDRENGLSQVTINDLLVDEDHFLWIATQHGINRFDGHLFTHFLADEKDAQSPLSNSPEHFSKDKNGRIWIGTQDAGLSYYEPSQGAFIPFLLPLNSSAITSLIYSEKNDLLWVGTAASGLFELDLTKDSISYRRHLKEKSISGLGMMHDQILVGTADGEVYEKDVGTASDLRLIANIKNSIYAFYSHQQKILICATDGLFSIDRKTAEFHKIKLESNSSKHLRAFLKENEQEVWIATGNGLFLFNLEQERSIQKISIQGVNDQVLSNNTIQSLARISEDVIAVGTANGLNLIDFSTGYFKNISKDQLGKHLLNDNVIFSILKHNDDLWVGTTDGGLNLIRNGVSYFYYKNEEAGKNIDGTVRAIKIDQDRQRLWVATTRGLHMTKLPVGNPKQVKFRSFYHDANVSNSISEDFIKDLDIDEEGRVWCATSKTGVFSLDLRQDGKVNIKKYRSSDSENPIVDDIGQAISCHEDKVWVGFQGGLSIISEQKVVNYRNDPNDKNSLTHNSILDILIQKDGTTWVGCRNGINRFIEGGGFVNWLQEGQQPPTIIYAIQDDDKGNLWMGTGNGILRFDPVKEIFTLFNEEDGIQDNEFDIHARFRDKDGIIYLGGIAGLTYFHPSDLQGIDEPRSLYFSDLTVQGKPIQRDSRKKYFDGVGLADSKLLRIHKKDFPFNLEFSTLDYRNIGFYQLAYRLLPNNENWTFLEVDNRNIQFVNLPSGKSTLEINGFSRGGVWQSDPLSIEVKVFPPWWLSWWTFLIYGIILSLLFYWFYWFQLSRKLLMNESHRLKELDILKNEFYTNITHEFRTPLTIIMGMVDNLKSTQQSVEVKKSIDQIGKNSDRLLKLVNEILNLVKLENNKVSLNFIQGNVISFISYIVESLKYLAKTKTIELIFYAEQDEINMDYDPERLSTVIVNLISNAIKFTPEKGQIFIHSSSSENEGKQILNINVKDNGKGIAKDDLPFIFKKYFQSSVDGEMTKPGNGIGLALTKELVNAMSGRISVESIENEGATFKVRIPISNNATFEEFLPHPLSPIGNNEKLDAKFPNEMDPSLPLVLVVEDNEDIAAYIISCLDNYNVVLANNGVQGKEIAELRIPEIIISDIMMPEMDGYELCKRLKSNLKTDHIPVILLTAKASEKDKILGFMHGADAYLTKPFSKLELIARIDQLIGSRKSILAKVQNQGIESFIRENREDPSLKFLNLAIATIHANIDNTLFGPPIFAKEMGMSESQLYKKLKATTGKSTALFIRSIRLERAKILLLTTQKTISEVSYDTGFNDPSWFSRAFKVEFGYTPSEVENS